MQNEPDEFDSEEDDDVDELMEPEEGLDMEIEKIEQQGKSTSNQSSLVSRRRIEEILAEKRLRKELDYLFDEDDDFSEND